VLTGRSSLCYSSYHQILFGGRRLEQTNLTSFIVFSDKMQVYHFVLLLALVYEVPAARRYQSRRRVARQNFRRDAVEKIADYPFRRGFSQARREDAPKSSLMEYVWGGFGTKTLPLRDAVESLPTPLRVSEER